MNKKTGFYIILFLCGLIISGCSDSYFMDCTGFIGTVTSLQTVLEATMTAQFLSMYTLAMAIIITRKMFFI